VRVELAAAADAEALRNLHAETWADAYAERLPAAFYARGLAQHRRRDWAELIADQLASGGGVLVAREPTGLVGLCQYGQSEDDDECAPGVGQIHRLYVHPSSQRRGVGRALLADAVERLLAGGALSVTLWVLESDAGARAFYERLGWRPDGGRRFDGATDLRYRRAAAGPLS
jgi:ribosomal protein S18 acetylase RimI-like enzyme